MKELCAYKAEKNRKMALHRQEMIRIYGRCTGLTDKEYKKSTVRQKNNFPQQHKFTHNKMWRTNIKRYSVEQLKIIAKT